MSKNLFEQLSDVGRDATAQMIGAQDCPAFRNHLRTMPSLPEDFTIGDAARAYLKSRLEYLESL